MEQVKPSITELASLVEKLGDLAAHLAREPELVSAAPPPLVGGLPLEHWLPGRWPTGPSGRSLFLSRRALDDLLQRLNAQRQRQRAELASRREARDSLISNQTATLERIQVDLAAAHEELAEAGARLPELERLTARTVTAAQAARQRAAGLSRWLNQVRPRGVSRFVDAEGRVLSQATLAKAKDRTEDAWRQAKSLERQAAEAGAMRDQAMARREAAAAALGRARAARDQCRNRGDACERAALELDLLRQKLADTEKTCARALSLRVLYGRLLDAAGQFMPAPPSRERSVDAPRALEDADRLRGQMARRQRLADLCRRLETRLTRREEAAAELSRQVRRINRDTAAMEKELPGLLAALTTPGVGERERAEAAAGLTSLQGRAAALRPPARRAAQDLAALVETGQVDLERLRGLLEAYKETAKDQRAGQTSMLAVRDEARLAARNLRREQEELRALARPLMEALGTLVPADLEPALLNLARAVAALEAEAVEMDALDRALADLCRDTLPAGPIRTPVKIKPHTAMHRRLAGRHVEIERLAAVGRGARQWLNAATGPLSRTLSRPAEDVAMAVGQSLSLAVAERERTLKELAAVADSLAAAEARSREERRRADRRLDDQRRLLAERDRQVEDLREQGRGQRAEMDRMGRRLALFDDLEKAAAGLEERLAEADRGRQMEARGRQISQARADALKAKSLGLHQSLKEARAAHRQALEWREAHAQLGRVNARTRGELDSARRELSRTRAQVDKLRASRDQTRRELTAAHGLIEAQEQELIRLRLLEAELEASRAEAARWAATAGDLSTALAAAGQAADEAAGQAADERRAMEAELARVGAQAHRLEQQLGRLSVMVAMSWQPTQETRRPMAVRLTPLTPEQVEKALKRLSEARKRLTRLGGATLGHWAMILGLTTGLVVMQPGTPSKATLHESPLALSHLTRSSSAVTEVSRQPSLDLAASGLTLAPPVNVASVSMELVPLHGGSQQLSSQMRGQVRALARRAGLSPSALMVSAQAAFQGRAAVEPDELEELAESARLIAHRHPGIFRDIVPTGLPVAALDLARLEGETEEGRHLFLDRLYREYRALGFEPAEALGACAANERAAKSMLEAWVLPDVYAGKVRPIKAVEKLDLESFLDRVSPYISERCQWFLKATGRSFAGDVNRYARYLAYDIYCAAKKFDVPVSLMLAVAHQETFYANVLGDQRRSASPFQIFRPTLKLICDSLERSRFVPPPKSVKLQEHLTMATFLAAFHLRELMLEAYRPPAGHRPAFIDMDRVMKRYNGSSLYAGRVAEKRAELAAFLRSTAQDQGKI